MLEPWHFCLAKLQYASPEPLLSTLTQPPLLALPSLLPPWENVSPAAGPQPGATRRASLSFSEITHNRFTFRPRTGAAARMANTARSVAGKASHQRCWEAVSWLAPALALAPLRSTDAACHTEIRIILMEPAPPAHRLVINRHLHGNEL